MNLKHFSNKNALFTIGISFLIMYPFISCDGFTPMENSTINNSEDLSDTPLPKIKPVAERVGEFSYNEFSGNVIYVDGNAEDDFGSGEEADPKKFIPSGLAMLQAGDMLWIRDGIYEGTQNAIGDHGTPQVYPPNGISSDQPTIIRSDTVGGVIIDGEYNVTPFSNYSGPFLTNIIVEGIHFRNGGNNSATINDYLGAISIKGNNIKIMRSGFNDAFSSDISNFAGIINVVGGSQNILFEDIFVWGLGRSGISLDPSSGGTQDILIRRAVLRLDSSAGGFESATIEIKGSNGSACLNCFVLDSSPSSTSSNLSAIHVKDSPNTVIAGSVIHNNELMSGIRLSGDNNGSSIKNSLVWANGEHGVEVENANYSVQIENVISGGNLGSGFYRPEGSNTQTQTEYVMSLSNGEYGFHNWIQHSNLITYSNSLGDQYLTSPQSSIEDADVFNLGLVAHLLEIPEHQSLTSDIDSNKINPNIVKFIGANASHIGDADWDKTTEETLWPYPYEELWIERIQTHSVSVSGQPVISGDRGFAEDALDPIGRKLRLTTYLWEILGNRCPYLYCRYDD